MFNGHQHGRRSSSRLPWQVRETDQSRPSIILLSLSREFDPGNIDVWDLLFKQNEPTLSVRVTDEPLHCLRVQEPQGRLVACGSQSGTVTLLEVSDHLRVQARNERSLVGGVRLLAMTRMLMEDKSNRLDV